MRYLRVLAVAGLAVSSLLTAAPALAATGGHAAALPTPTKIVLFHGGSTKEIGPANQSTNWTASTSPAKIVTTNDGTLEQSSDVPTGCIFSSGCGDWRYKIGPGWVQDLEFYWVKPGSSPRVYATDLVPSLASNNAEWASLGGGVYTPLCLSWIVTNTKTNTSTGYSIKLNLTTHKWSKITAAELSTC